MSRTLRVLGYLILLVLLFLLASCGNARTDFFDYLDESRRPTWINVWPMPGTVPFTQPQRVKIDQPAGYEAWSIHYSLEPATVADADIAWIPYDEAADFYLARDAHLRVCLDGGGDEVSRIFSFDYAFDAAVERSFYVSASAAAGGDGLNPATAFRTIQEGIAAAATLRADGLGSVTVRVRRGTYAESPVMGAGIVLIGSYHDNWIPRQDMETSPSTVIMGTQAAMTEGTDPPFDAVPGYGLRVTEDASADETVIRDVEVRAPDLTDYGASILVERSGVRIERVSAYGDGLSFQCGIWFRSGGGTVEGSTVGGSLDGSGYGERSAGVIAIDSTVEVRDSAIRSGVFQGGVALPQYCYGAALIRYQGEASLLIEGGSAEGAGDGDVLESYGVYAMGGELTVRGCESVRAGNAPFPANGARSVGVFVSAAENGESGSALIEDNALIQAAGTGSGGPAALSAGILVGEGAQATVRRTGRIQAGPAPFSAGIVMRGLGLELSDNPDIRGGAPGTGSSAGVAVQLGAALGGAVIIQRNAIWGGSAPTHIGVAVGLDADPLWPVIVRNNAIQGGGGSGPGHGIHVTSALADAPAATAYFLNNTVLSGSTANGAAVHVAGNAKPVFIGNIIRGERYGVYVLTDGTGASDPGEFRNNALWAPAGSGNQYVTFGAGLVTPLDLVELLARGYSGNQYYEEPIDVFAGDESLLGDEAGFLGFDFRLDAGADAFLRTGAPDLSAYFTGTWAGLNDALDRYGAARTGSAGTGWSVGAAEY